MAVNFKRAKAVINLKNAKHNFLTIKNKLRSTKICCVVKADAYGHGAVRLSNLYQKLGAHFFATATFEEAKMLRKNGIKKPILILGYTPPYLVKQLEFYNLSQTIHSFEYASTLLKFCKKKCANIKIHLKIDTGLGRVGFVSSNKQVDGLNEAVSILTNAKNFVLEGIYTHFACSDNYLLGKAYTIKQFKNFKFAIKYLSKSGINFKIRHCGNSAVLFNYPKYYLDMVRVGIALYGVLPTKSASNLKRVMELKTIIESVKIIKKGENVGYGLECFAKKDMLLATLPVGYADGIMRSTYKTNYKVLVNGKYCPFFGRVNMDKCTIDVTNLNVKVFDEVLIFGEDKVSNVENLSILNGTIPYETLCSVTKRVIRVYK